MKLLVKDYLATHGIAIIEVTSYSTRINNKDKEDFFVNIVVSELWSFIISIIQKIK